MLSLANKHILVTGGAGLIGSHLVDLLIEKGAKVRIFDNLEPQTHPAGPPAWISPRAQFIRGDVREAEAFRKALEGIDLVFHQAAFGGFTDEISKYVEVNTLGTVRLFELIRRFNFPVQKIVVASSQAVYGEGAYRCSEHGLQFPRPRPLEKLNNQVWEVICSGCHRELQSLPTPEIKSKDGETIYALTKASEEWALQFGRNLQIPVVILRYGVTYGPRQSIFNPYTGVVSIFSVRFLTGQPPVIYEDGNQTRDFVYVGDVARANALVMENDAADFGTFNVATGQATSARKLAEILKSLYGIQNLEPEIRGAFRPGDVRHLVLDAGKLRSLGWKPEVSLEEGLSFYRQWIETQGKLRDYFQQAETFLKKAGIVQESPAVPRKP